MSCKLYADKGIALNHAAALADANGAPVAVWSTEDPGYLFEALVDPTEVV
jgi:hypothetical protein